MSSVIHSKNKEVAVEGVVAVGIIEEEDENEHKGGVLLIKLAPQKATSNSEESSVMPARNLVT